MVINFEEISKSQSFICLTGLKASYSPCVEFVKVLAGLVSGLSFQNQEVLRVLKIHVFLPDSSKVVFRYSKMLSRLKQKFYII